MESTEKPLYLSLEECVDYIIEQFGPEITIGPPLGLGKPVPLVNSLYQRVKSDPGLCLTIFTALSLEKPSWTNELERRFLEPFVNRVYEGVPDLDYLTDLRKNELPANIKIHELYCKAGAYNNNPEMQQNYMSTNYTHVVRDCAINGNRIYANMLARNDSNRHRCYSASCNADTTIEALSEFRKLRQHREKALCIGVVNAYLPFMYGDAEIAPEQYDIIIDTGECDHPLFNTPRMPVNDPDYMIGLHASTLIRDGGTLQIGIGALGDAIASTLDMRHNRNDVYQKVLRDAGTGDTYASLIKEIGGTGTFEQGIYGSTEMLVDGFLQLYKSGVIKRRVYHHIGIQALLNKGLITEQIPPEMLSMMIDREVLHPYLTRREFQSLQRFGVLREDLSYENGEIITPEGRSFSANLADPENLAEVSQNCLGTCLKNGAVLTGSFFIGPRDFYDTLRDMSEAERRQFEMVGVEVANQLYGNEDLRRLQRREARFCNTGMKATLLGHIVSDGLEDGTVVSGVGGQYNFVAMSHAIPDARAIMLIKSTRQESGKALSNIVYNYGHVTIPRHLRDIVVTEYGIADIRGKCDSDIIKEMLRITDSRFQEELLAEAKKHNKIEADYKIPEAYRNNTPECISALLQPYMAEGEFGPFPFGSEFDLVEMILAHSLKVLKQKYSSDSADELGPMIDQMPDTPPENAVPMLERMGLENPGDSDEAFMQKTVLAGMKLAGML
ncbi:MAG: acetyl-CoA hydrolase/transferase C-terminal domain-containing protein [Desulfobacterales bacterium]